MNKKNSLLASMIFSVGGNALQSNVLEYLDYFFFNVTGTLNVTPVISLQRYRMLPFGVGSVKEELHHADGRNSKRVLMINNLLYQEVIIKNMAGNHKCKCHQDLSLLLVQNWAH